jgi:hypothetical protein
MKTKFKLLVLVAGTLAAGCWSVVYQPSKEEVCGTFQRKEGNHTFMSVFQINGGCEEYKDGIKQAEGVWKIIEGKVEVDMDDRAYSIFNIEPNGDLRLIEVVVVRAGERETLDLHEGGVLKAIKSLENLIVGTYVDKDVEAASFKVIFLRNGVCEDYVRGIKHGEYEWSMINGEVHVRDEKANVAIFRIKPDGGIINISGIKNGKRENFAREDQVSLKRIE